MSSSGFALAYNRCLEFYMTYYPVRFRLIVGLLLASCIFLLIAILYRAFKKRKGQEAVAEAVASDDFTDIEEVEVAVQSPSPSWITRQFRFVNLMLWSSLISVILALTVVVLPKKPLPNYPTTENLGLSESPYIFGVDISHYQGLIDWNQFKQSHHPIEFVFIRATMGIDGRDNYYKINWNKAGEKGYLRGAYHFYRPHEKSADQFENFKKVVALSPGDFPPVLDVEHYSKFGNENLRAGVLNWLLLAEAHYGIKPIIYTGSNFYHNVLKGYVDGYPLWIADYTKPHHQLQGIDWTFHQFTDKVRIKGVPHLVDGNDFKGTKFDLLKLTYRSQDIEEVIAPQ